MLCKRSPSVELVTIFRFIMRLEYDMITHPLWECFILYFVILIDILFLIL